MLTRDLLRFRTGDGVVTPFQLRKSPAVMELAERLVEFYRAGVGQLREDLDENVLPLLHQARSLVVSRGLDKLLRDGCRFVEPESMQDQRWQALERSAALLKAGPSPTAKEHRRQVAGELGLTPEGLEERIYADHPDRSRLAEPPDTTASRLIDRYNLAQAQGLLLSARSLVAILRDRDPGRRRLLLKTLRFRRLLAWVRTLDDGALRLEISGPCSVLDQRQGYGLQLALFLPGLACLHDWSAQARVRPPRHDGECDLHLASGMGLLGDVRFLGFVPEELRGLSEKLAKHLPEARISDAPPLLPLPGGEIVVCDFALELPAGRVDVELFHRWHATALKRRLDQLASGAAPRLLLGVDRALGRLAACRDLLRHPVLERQGFLFSGFPGPTALRKAALALLSGPTAPSA